MSRTVAAAASRFLTRPQTTLVRRALFQIHLWMGLLVATSVCVIGVTGAALVFRPEMQKVTFTEIFAPNRAARRGTWTGAMR